MSYYEPLTRFLAGHQPGEVVLTFRELERILGRSLPPSARKHQAWWANTTSHSHAEAWLRLAWKTSNVDLRSERVTFTRNESAPVDRGRKHDFPGGEDVWVRVNIGQLSVAGRRLVNDYAAEMGGDLPSALARAAHEAAIARRGRLIDKIRANAPRVAAGEKDSVELIREDRDAR
ncbi:MAG TPA: hypothetical protein VII63_11495 [Caulobacteraceae bacterium]